MYHRALDCKRHAHGRAFFAFLVSGGFTESNGREELRYAPGTIGFHPAGMTHGDETAMGTRLFLIEVGDRWFKRLGEYSSRLDFAPALCGGDAGWLAAQLYDAVKETSTIFPLLVEGIIADLLMSAGRVRVGRERAKPRWLERAVEVIHAELSGELRLETIAAHAGVHPAYLSRIFRKTYGESVGHYVNRLRVRRASAELAKKRGLPLSEVALEAGFADQSHFTRIFKQIAGITPGAFRAAAPTN